MILPKVLTLGHQLAPARLELNRASSFSACGRRSGRASLLTVYLWWIGLARFGRRSSFEPSIRLQTSRIVTRLLLSSVFVVSVFERAALLWPSFRRACLLVRGPVVNSRFSGVWTTPRERPRVGPPSDRGSFPLGTQSRNFFSNVPYRIIRLLPWVPNGGAGGQTRLVPRRNTGSLNLYRSGTVPI
jgi:hypothetical protein